MGKAGKWIRNFLLGKKEEKFKKIDTYSTENKSANMVDSEIVCPKVKRRWSFGKLRGGSGRRTTSTVTAGHKFSLSFDSRGNSAKLQMQALLETQAPKSFSTSLAKVYEDRKDKTAAAIKIQAAFRSYLARRALHALKGLVKLQALVRGYLVRKQTTSTLRGMHALMTIQVRARIHRIQMVEEANILGKQPPQHREIPHPKGLKRENKDSKNMSLEEMREVWKSRSAPLDRSDMNIMEHDSTTFYSNRMSISKQQYQYKENALITAPNSPENYQSMSKFNPTTIALSSSERHSVSHHQPWSPSYMNKTESSRAKARSLSEPKQRPKRRHKNKSVESTKELITSLSGPRHSVSSNSSSFDHGSQDHWIINLYGNGSMTMKNSRRDSSGSSTANSDSYY